jgi:hypothetical protein
MYRAMERLKADPTGEEGTPLSGGGGLGAAPRGAEIRHFRVYLSCRVPTAVATPVDTPL